MPTPAETIASEIHDLINRSPRSPTKAQIADCIQVMLDVVQEDGDRAITVPLGTVVQPQRPGAFVRVEANLSLTVDGFQVAAPRPLTNQEGALAVLDWLRKGVLTAPRQ